MWNNGCARVANRLCKCCTTVVQVLHNGRVSVTLRSCKCCRWEVRQRLRNRPHKTFFTKPYMVSGLMTNLLFKPGKILKMLDKFRFIIVNFRWCGAGTLIWWTVIEPSFLGLSRVHSGCTWCELHVDGLLLLYIRPVYKKSRPVIKLLNSRKK